MAHLVESQVGALRIADGQTQEAPVGADQKSVAAKAEVKPCPGMPQVDEIHDFHVRQKQHVVA